MTGHVDIDTRALRDGATSLGDAASELSGHLQSLTGNAPAWGEDDISQLCKMVYDAIVEVVNESAGAVGETWGDHGQKLTAAAAAHDATEAANAQIAGTTMEA